MIYRIESIYIFSQTCIFTGDTTAQNKSQYIMPSGNSYKLIAMTSFVIEYYSNEGYADLQTLKMIIQYAQF